MPQEIDGEWRQYPEQSCHQDSLQDHRSVQISQQTRGKCFVGHGRRECHHVDGEKHQKAGDADGAVVGRSKYELQRGNKNFHSLLLKINVSDRRMLSPTFA
ncbi:MAG: hypothetical protein ACRETQ_01345 [Gammaproteobacteria bacterium]